MHLFQSSPMTPTSNHHHHRHRSISGPGHGNIYLFPLFTLLLLISTADAQSDSSTPPGQYPGFSPNFNPAMAIIIVVLIGAFFLMGFFSIYFRQCSGDRADSGGGGRSNRGRPGAGWSRRLAARGLDAAVIGTFPTLVYSDVKGLKIGKGALECAVCLSEFEDDETLRLLPKCSHVFHPDCIDAWLVSHTTCPVCRCNLVPDPNAPPAAVDATVTANSASVGEEREDEVAEAPQDHVAIDVDERAEETDPRRVQPLDLGRIGSKNWVPWRSRSSALAARLPRSHSTGHSVVQPGENVERFTLRLPAQVRREIMAGKLHRSTSCVAFPVGEGSSRRGYRGSGGAGGEGSIRGVGGSGGKSFKLGRWEWAAKSDRWAFLTLSFRVSKAGDGEGSTRRGEGSTTKKGGGEGEGSARGKMFPSVKGPFECLSGGAKADGAADDDEPSTTALAARV